jgi:hypothetical protein
VIPERAAEFKEALNYCFDTNEKMFSHKDIGMYLKRGYDSIFTDPVMSGAIKKAGGFPRANGADEVLLGQAIWASRRQRFLGISMMYATTTAFKDGWKAKTQQTKWDDTPIAEIDAFVSKHCKNGASILVSSRSAGDHELTRHSLSATTS